MSRGEMVRDESSGWKKVAAAVKSGSDSRFLLRIKTPD